MLYFVLFDFVLLGHIVDAVLVYDDDGFVVVVDAEYVTKGGHPSNRWRRIFPTVFGVTYSDHTKYLSSNPRTMEMITHSL